MSVIRSFVKKLTGANRFIVETEKDGVLFSDPIIVVGAAAAFDQAKADQIAALAGLTYVSTVIATNAT